MALDAGDITARQAGYINSDGMLTDLGKQYVDEILERLGVPQGPVITRLTPSEMGKRSAAKRATQKNIALDVARREAR